jgi:peptidoglycan/xylan/chitin deacetylase (PgdA/CDA1 family)
VLLAGGSTMLSGCGQLEEIQSADAAPIATGELVINGAAEGNLVQAMRPEQPAPHIDLSQQNIRELYDAGGLYRSFDVGGQKIVHLTFDDGPWPKNTIAIMDILAQNGLEGYATFFEVGDNLRQFNDIGREVVRRGYLIGNHSKTHSTYVPHEIAAEIVPAQEEIFQLLGVRPDLFRSPGLTSGQIIQDVLAELGMCNIFTDQDPHDWANPRISAADIIANIRRQAHPGLINLLHDGGSHQETVDAIQGVIDTFRELGYTFVTMKQMMQAARGAVFTTERTQLYIPRLQVPDYSVDTFDAKAEWAKLNPQT